MQEVIVFVIVALALCHLIWRLLPWGARRWLLAGLGLVLPPCRTWLAKMEAGREASGCGGCTGCGPVRPRQAPRQGS